MKSWKLSGRIGTEQWVEIDERSDRQELNGRN
jgi:hypothetical protein